MPSTDVWMRCYATHPRILDNENGRERRGDDDGGDDDSGMRPDFDFFEDEEMEDDEEEGKFTAQQQEPMMKSERTSEARISSRKQFRQVPVMRDIMEEIRKHKTARFLVKGSTNYPHLGLELGSHIREVWGKGAVYVSSLADPEDRESTPPLENEVNVNYRDPRALKKEHLQMPEIAFMGRSNVGKSSLLNRLVGRNLAVLEDRPGTTRRVNRYELKSRKLALLDLPGYGFAFGGTSWWEHALNQIAIRPQLKRIILLVDARHGLKVPDREVLQIMHRRKHIPRIQIVVNKCDLEHAEDLARRICLIKQEVTKEYPQVLPDILCVSAYTMAGVRNLMMKLANLVPLDSKQVAAAHSKSQKSPANPASKEDSGNEEDQPAYQRVVRPSPFPKKAKSTTTSNDDQEKHSTRPKKKSFNRFPGEYSIRNVSLSALLRKRKEEYLQRQQDRWANKYQK